MSLVFQSHSGARRASKPQKRSVVMNEALIPDDGSVSVDEAADFGYVLPPSGNPGDYLPDDCGPELDQLGSLMVPTEDPNDPSDPHKTPDSVLPAVFTYWGQFLDHELTAKTDRESEISKIENDPAPSKSANEIEVMLKNARTPRFDLDSVYGGVAVGAGAAEGLAKEVATVISGMRHPTLRDKMRVGTAFNAGNKPDNLDEHRDLPRFRQVEAKVRDAYLAIAQATMSPTEFTKLQAGLDKRAIIGDMRNDENIIVAQFHLSFLRFHNRVVDFLAANDTGWIADFHSAKALTTLHYQWLIVEGYLKNICDPAVVHSVLANRAKHFKEFRAAYYGRVGASNLGDVLPLEFSVAAYRFGHTMVRNAYDYNNTFGRPNGTAPFDQVFRFTGGGDLGAEFGLPGDRIPQNWIIDWSRFVNADPNNSDGKPARVARALDTQLAPPLGDMFNVDNDKPENDPIRILNRHLARRNLRRGLSLRLPTGQALHAHLNQIGAIPGAPIGDVSTVIQGNQPLADFLKNSSAKFFERTPLWFYVLAEAEAAGGNHLGELGSWLVASTFVGCLLDDPDSALSQDFTPDQSPLRMPDDTPIDSIEKWMRFGVVLE